ncbi:MAG: PQQ-binding-like beta-propeller repeat protein [Pseudomonadota bacterium]
MTDTPQSSLTRRKLLGYGGKLAAASATASLLPGIAGEDTAQAARIKLPPWAYGRTSAATDTVLMFRGNPAHTFYGTGPIPDAPRRLWRFRTASIRNVIRGRPTVWTGTGWTGTAVVLGNYVFVGSVGGYVYAFERRTGKLVWKHRGGGMFKGSLCAYENRLYIGNTDNLLRCLDATTGRRIWTHNTGRDLDSSPCVVDGRLYIAGENGFARCINPRTGKLIWKTFMGGIGPGTLPGSNGSETSPAVADGDYYAVNYHGKMFCLDIKRGKVRWTARTGDDTDASPVVAGEFVYAAAEEKAPYLHCFEREKGRPVWRYDGNRGGYYSTPAVVGDRIYIGGEDARLHCVNARTGKQIWTFKTGAAIWSSPAVVDGKVVFGSRDGRLYIVDAQTGTLIWKTRVDGRIISSPCIVDGTIYIGTATGYFYAFGA